MADEVMSRDERRAWRFWGAVGVVGGALCGAVGLQPKNHGQDLVGVAAVMIVLGVLCWKWPTVDPAKRDKISTVAKGIGALIAIPLVVAGTALCFVLGAGLFLYVVATAPLAVLILLLVLG